MSAPRVTAVVELDDKATPHLKKIVEMFDELNKKSQLSAREMATGVTAAAREMGQAFAATHVEAKKLFESAAPATMAKNIHKVTTATNELERSLGRTHGVMGKLLESLHSLPATIAGGTIAHTAHSVYEKAAEYSHAEYRNFIAGMTPEQVAKAKVEAVKLQALIPGVSITSSQHLAGSMNAVMKDEHEAEHVAPSLMKYRAAMRLAHPEEDDHALDERVHNALKFGEATGANTSAEAMSKVLDKLTRATNFDQNLIRAEDPLLLSQQAGSAMKMLTETGMKVAIQLMAEWHGDRTGTFLSAIQKYSAGTGFDNHKSAIQDLVDKGMVDKRDVNEKGNAIKQGSPSQLRLQKLSANPLAWVDEDFVPAMNKAWDKMDPKKRQAAVTAFQKQYASDLKEDPKAALHTADGKDVDPSKMTAKDQFILNQLRRMFPNVVAARGLGEIYIQRDSIAAKNERIDKASGVDDTIEKSKTDPIAQMTALNNALSNFATIAGGPGMELAAKGLSTLASGIGSLTKYLADNPTLNKVAAGGIFGAGVLGAGVATYGLYSMATAGPKLSTAAAELTGAAVALKGSAVRGPNGTMPGTGSPNRPGFSTLPGILGLLGIVLDDAYDKRTDNQKIEGSFNNGKAWNDFFDKWNPFKSIGIGKGDPTRDPIVDGVNKIFGWRQPVNPTLPPPPPAKPEPLRRSLSEQVDDAIKRQSLEARKDRDAAPDAAGKSISVTGTAEMRVNANVMVGLKPEVMTLIDTKIQAGLTRDRLGTNDGTSQGLKPAGTAGNQSPTGSAYH